MIIHDHTEYPQYPPMFWTPKRIDAILKTEGSSRYLYTHARRTPAAHRRVAPFEGYHFPVGRSHGFGSRSNQQSGHIQLTGSMQKGPASRDAAAIPRGASDRWHEFGNFIMAIHHHCHCDSFCLPQMDWFMGKLMLDIQGL